MKSIEVYCDINIEEVSIFQLPAGVDRVKCVVSPEEMVLYVSGIPCIMQLLTLMHVLLGYDPSGEGLGWCYNMHVLGALTFGLT
jgi:hypothetical protein